MVHLGEAFGLGNALDVDVLTAKPQAEINHTALHLWIHLLTCFVVNDELEAPGSLQGRIVPPEVEQVGHRGEGACAQVDAVRRELASVRALLPCSCWWLRGWYIFAILFLGWRTLRFFFRSLLSLRLFSKFFFCQVFVRGDVLNLRELGVLEDLLHANLHVLQPIFKESRLQVLVAFNVTVDERIFNIGQQWMVLTELDEGFGQLLVCLSTFDAFGLIFVWIFRVFVEGLVGVTVDSDSEHILLNFSFCSVVVRLRVDGVLPV